MVVLLKVAASSLLYELSVNTGTVSQGADRIYIRTEFNCELKRQTIGKKISNDESQR